MLSKNTSLYNVNNDEIEKLGGLFVMRGKEQIEVDEIHAGDIGAKQSLLEHKLVILFAIKTT